MMLGWLLFMSISVFGQQVVHDLEPEWVYFDIDNQGFLPAVMEVGAGSAISFELPTDDYGQFYLRLILGEEAYLFHNNQLVLGLPQGTTYLPIDSLRDALKVANPMLTIYSEYLSKGLSTSVVESRGGEVVLVSDRAKDAAFNDFFILAGVILLVGFVFLRLAFSDVFNQYADFLRIFDLKTIDELIYKLHFFGRPNIYFQILVSLLVGWSLIAFHHSYPTVLNNDLFKGEGDSFSGLVFTWLKLSSFSFALLLLKYIIIYLSSSLFAFNSVNVHYASHLRLVFWLAILVASFTVVNYFFYQTAIVHVIFLGTMFLSVARIILIFLRLLRITSHTVLHLLLYLCATEIIPFVFIYKLVIG